MICLIDYIFIHRTDDRNLFVLYRCSKTSVSYASLESAMIKFLSRCCWCHLENQKLLAELLTDVISQQRMTSSRTIYFISYYFHSMYYIKYLLNRYTLSSWNFGFHEAINFAIIIGR